MKQVVLISAALLLAITASAWAAEPIVGTWQLDHQELNGQKKEAEQLMLRVTPAGDKYLFAFSIPINNIEFVSMSYTTKLDGSDADIKNARGFKVGTVQVTTPSPSHYKLVMKGDKRPDSNTKLTVSADGNTLVSESDSKQADQPMHLVQTFSRH